MKQHLSYKKDEQVSSLNMSNVTSPLSAAKLVAKVNSLSDSPIAPQKKQIRQSMMLPQKAEIDYKSIINEISTITTLQDINAYYLAVHKILTTYLNCSFTAYGLYNETSKCINLKLIDKNDNVYSSKIF